MEFNVDARRLQLENLKQFISSSKDKVQNILTTLGWNEKEVLRDKQLITCSLDTNHKVPPKYVDKHIEKCILRKENYDLKEKFLSEPQSGANSIRIDDHKKIEILSTAHKLIENFKSDCNKVVLKSQYNQIYVITWNGQDPDPRTSERLVTTFSTDERLALYDYAVANTVQTPKLPEFDTVTPKRKEDKPLTYEEKLALERDIKRRKIKYKSIHTSHKNHTEVLREVIESQMELYRDWLVKNEDSTNSKEIEHASEDLELEHIRSTTVSRNSNISSSSQSTQKKYEEKSKEEMQIDSCSTSRRTSIDRESDKSNTEIIKYRKHRSRSHDSHHQRYREDHYKKHYPERFDYHHSRDYRQSDRYRHDKYRYRSPTSRRRSSKERKHNGYKNHRH